MDEYILKILSQKGVLEILENLDRKKSLKYKELEEFVGNPSTTSRRLNTLEKKGLVERHVSSEKYRPVYYRLTDKGRKLLFLVKEMHESYG